MSKQSKWLSGVSAFFVGLIALAAFVLSFKAIQELAITNGVDPGLAWLVPLIVDGAMLVFSVSVLRATLAHEAAWWGWILIVGFTAVSVAFNWAHSNLTLWGVAIAILAPLALFFSFETLMSQIRSALKGGINALAVRWRQRARELLRLAKEWRQRARELQEALKTADDTILDLQEQVEAMQGRITNLTQDNRQIAGLQRENKSLQEQIARLQNLAAAWEHMNEKSQAAAMYNAGLYGDLEQAAKSGGVSASTISRLARQMNGAE